MDDKILLGRIKEIRQYKLILSLPHHKIGVCQLNDVSQQYCKILEYMTQNENVNENASEEVPSLSDLFVIGQVVQAKLRKSSGNKINVTLLPSDVNADINIKHIKSGMKLQVAIQSSEDKGYILETGIKGMNGFLPFDKCKNAKYKIGQLLEAFPIVTGRKMNAGVSRVFNFTTVNDKLVSSTFTASNLIEFSSLVPGMFISTNLKLATNGHLEGTFQGFPVSIKPDHQLYDELTTPEHILCIIGIDCGLKQLDCSQLPHLLPPFNGIDELLSVKIGHSEPNCVLQKIQKHQVTFSLPNLKYAKVTVQSEQVDAELKNLKINESTTVRFLDFNLMDNVIHATCLKRLLALSYFSVNQAKIGEIIKGTVKGYQKIGFAVQISSTLSGFIPIQHLKDSQVKAPSTVYKSGDEIRCRVFHIDHEKNKLTLTVKKSFMNSVLPVVESMDELKPGMLLDAFVAKISEFGLLVVMFNNLKGWIRKSEIPNSQKTDLNVMFQKGQSLQVRFLRCDKGNGNITLSLLEPSARQEKEEEGAKSSVKVNVGQIYECVIKKMMKNGFNVRLMPFNKAAFLTFEQLSDSREHSALLKAYFSTCEGKEMKTNVVVVNTENFVVSVSRKHSLIRAATEERILTQNSEVTVGSQWLGWVSRREMFGAFVELPTGVTGLVPNKNITDTKPFGCDYKDLLREGDTVEVKVLEYDPEKPKKSLFTMKMSDTYNAKENLERDTIAFLANHLEERRFIKSLPPCASIAHMEIGDLVNVKVTSQLDWGFTVCVDDIVPGFVKNQHLPKVPLSVGCINTAVIIDIDLAEQSVELCMTGSVVNAVKNNNSKNKIQLKQVIKSDMLAFNSDFVVAMLLDHGNGSLAFIPTKRFWNDVSKEMCWIVNQRNLTVIKRALSSTSFIGSLQINEPIDQEENPKTAPKKLELVLTFKTLSNKVHITVGQRYPVFFHSVTKNKIFFFISKKQKCFCNLMEFSESLDELQQMLINPPEVRSLIAKRITITETEHHGTGLTCGHFLKKEIIEKGDEYCCKVLSICKNKECTVELPFNSRGTIDLIRNDHSKVKIVPKMASIIQCRVEDKEVEENKKVKISLTIVKVCNYVEETEVEEEAMKVDVVKKRTQVKKPKVIEHIGAMPEIVVSKRKEFAEETSLEQVYKRVHHDDDEIDCDEEDLDGDGKPSGAKRQKLSNEEQAEREMSIREAEQRRDTGEILKNPQSENEFELLVFNYPNDAGSWTRYMDFVMASEGGVDKCRSIGERAISALNSRDVTNKFTVMLKYVDLELDELVKCQDNHQMKRFETLFERCLVQKSRECYIHVCERIRSLKLFELAEKISKRFVKEMPHDSKSWFQLVAVRFEQKRFDVVKETMINGERLLKGVQYRELQMMVAKLEIDSGNGSRGKQILEALIEARPKDLVLKKKCLAIMTKAGMISQKDQSDSEME